MRLTEDCHQLDAYLGGELLPTDQARFEAHLRSCDLCREAVDEQIWIDDLLRSPQRAAIEPAPARLAPAVAAVVRRKRRRRLIGAAAAAVMAAVAAWGAVHRETLPDQTEVVAKSSPPLPEEEIEPAVFISGDDSIAVPVESEFPNVTIVQVYATYRPDRE
jgi:anti-sigma factor RsiW